MPTYQYACTSEDCGLRFERVQAFTDDAIDTCPDCTHQVRKVYGSVGVVFKGSGFYRNDSREAKTAAAAKADSGASAESKATEAKSTDKGSDSKGSEPKSGGDKAKSNGSGTSSGSSGSGSSAPAAKSSDRMKSAPVAS